MKVEEFIKQIDTIIKYKGQTTEITFKYEYEKGVKTIEIAESFEKIKKMLAIPEN